MPGGRIILDMAGGLDETGRVALALAREAVERYIRTGQIADPPADLSPSLREASAAFVTLRAHGQLRGCIGTLRPTRVHAGWEIIFSAVSAATGDPRFTPVLADELADLVYEVDLVGVLEAVADIDKLDPRVYGVVVEAEGRRGVLLPDLEGVDDAEQQVAVARHKAGLSGNSLVQLYRFEVRRFIEDRP